MQVADHNVDKLCRSIEDLLFIQFRRQGTKVFTKQLLTSFTVNTDVACITDARVVQTCGSIVNILT